MSEQSKPERVWPGRHVVELDLRSLALFRMLFGLVFLADCLIRWVDAAAHYSDLGLLPRRILLDAGWQINFWSVHMSGGQPLLIHLLFLVHMLLALALCWGYRTRVVTALSWILIVSIHNRNPWLLNGGDAYARVILFWMMFLPWGQVWSADARAGRTDFRWWTGKPSDDGTAVRSLACLGVLLQVSLLYWFAALPKTHPSWVGDYSAVNIALHLDHLVKPFGLFFREWFQEYLPFLTWAVYHWEVWAPFLLWFPFDRGQVRTLALMGFAALHIGFELTFELGLFPAYCLIVLVALLPIWVWERPLAWLSGKFDKVLGERRTIPWKDPGRIRRWSSEGLYLVLLLYIACWNFGNEQFRPGLWLPESWRWIGYTLRLDQRWNMFSPSPPYQDGWWVVKGILRSGEEVNLLHPNQPLEWEKPENIAGSYLTQRRRRWMMELRATGNPELMESYCRYLCWRANANPESLHAVRYVKLFYMLEMTLEDGTEAPPRRLKLFEYDHFPPRPREAILPSSGEIEP